MDAVGRSREEGGVCVSDSGEWSGKDAGGGDLPKRERERWGIARFKGSRSPSNAVFPHSYGPVGLILTVHLLEIRILFCLETARRLG
jgi:hypothetical protein